MEGIVQIEEKCGTQHAFYAGECYQSLRNGFGKYIDKLDGRTYIGEFKDDLRHGHGILTRCEGVEYVGDFCNDLRHGKGKQTNRKYSYEGDWLQDAKTGHGK